MEPSPNLPSQLAHLSPAGDGQPLSDHLLGVAAGCRARAAKIGLATAGELIGLLHDLGKYSDQFQQYLRSAVAAMEDSERAVPRKGSVVHSTAGAQVIWKRLKAKGQREAMFAEVLALCVASHHSGLIDCVSPSGKDSLTTRAESPETLSHLEQSWGKADSAIRSRAEQLLDDGRIVEELMRCFTAISKADKHEPTRRFKVGLLTRFLLSALIDADRTNTADSSKPSQVGLRQHGEYVGWKVLRDRLEESLAEFSNAMPIAQIRAQVSNQCLAAASRPQGIFTLTVPTGGGKTLASLRFALAHASRWGLDRVVYVSPYTSILDQNAAVVRGILEHADDEAGSIVLEHHSNLDPEDCTKKSKLLAENWDAPVVFTTGVQVLEALFGSGTRPLRRLHQLAKAVVIFDEAQTLPIRCVHLFNNAINFLTEQCGSSVVLCTATQPLLHKVDEAKGAAKLGQHSEIVDDVKTLYLALRRNTIIDNRRSRGWERPEVAELALSEVDRSGSCLIVVNTKADARSIFTAFQDSRSRVRAVHLSTAMCPAHRLAALAEMRDDLADGRPLVCVSTQLIEAGVDISFGSAIRDLAGLDSVVQTAGRCNRHSEREDGPVHIVNLTGRLHAKLIDIRKGQESCQRVLDEFGSGLGEKKFGTDAEELKRIERFYHYYFYERRNEMDYPVGPALAERDDTLLRMLSMNELASVRGLAAGRYFRQAFHSASSAFAAIDSATRGIVVPYGEAGRQIIGEICAAFELERRYELLRRAQRFTVAVYPHDLKRLETARAIYEAQECTGVLCLRDRYYSNEIGLDFEGSGELEAQFV